MDFRPLQTTNYLKANKLEKSSNYNKNHNMMDQLSMNLKKWIISENSNLLRKN